eukprot:3936415-Rhodomonas_salina.1
MDDRRVPLVQEAQPREELHPPAQRLRQRNPAHLPARPPRVEEVLQRPSAHELKDQVHCALLVRKIHAHEVHNRRMAERPREKFQVLHYAFCLAGVVRVESRAQLLHCHLSPLRLELRLEHTAVQTLPDVVANN